MTIYRTPIFLAPDREDAEELAAQLREAQIDAEFAEVMVGEARRGWRVRVAWHSAQAARELAEVFELERYGEWQSRSEEEKAWGLLEEEGEMRDPTPIYSAATVMQAHFLMNLLEDEGISAMVDNQVLHGGAGVDLVGTPTAATVLVAAKDAEAARQFALEFDDRVHGRREGERSSEFDGETAWPICPSCQARRTTRCPICETSGTDFPQADRGFLGDPAAAQASCDCSGSCSEASKEACGAAEERETGDERERPAMLLMCTVCDEPFHPSFPRHCEWCGHEFADGYTADEIVAEDDITNRAIAVFVLLGLLLLAGAIYFLVILSPPRDAQSAAPAAAATGASLAVSVSLGG